MQRCDRRQKHARLPSQQVQGLQFLPWVPWSSSLSQTTESITKIRKLSKDSDIREIVMQETRTETLIGKGVI